MEKEYSLEAKKPMPRHFSSLSSVLQLVCIADCETVSKAFTTVSIVSEALFIYDMTSALADSKNFGGNLSAKTVLFVKKI